MDVDLRPDPAVRGGAGPLRAKGDVRPEVEQSLAQDLPEGMAWGGVHARPPSPAQPSPAQPACSHSGHAVVGSPLFCRRSQTGQQRLARHAHGSVFLCRDHFRPRHYPRLPVSNRRHRQIGLHTTPLS